MWLKAQNEMTDLWPHAAIGPIERVLRQHLRYFKGVFRFKFQHSFNLNDLRRHSSSRNLIRYFYGL